MSTTSQIVTRLKLSEAIRLGSMLRPQAYGQNWRDGGSCAIGAAYDAIGHVSQAFYPIQWERLMATRSTVCPQCGSRSRFGDGLGQMVAHINDDHRWTRERIADYVEQIENAQSESAKEPECLQQTTS